MGEILGVGCTHRPLMLRPNEDWTFMLRAALDDPAMPEEMRLSGSFKRNTSIHATSCVIRPLQPESRSSR